MHFLREAKEITAFISLAASCLLQSAFKQTQKNEIYNIFALHNHY